MLDKKKIEKFVEEHLQETDKFLVDVEVSSGNVVDVFVDGDHGISIGECAKISRQIEAAFDREAEDYELRVSSPGLDRPFKMLRQYKNYTGRNIRLELADGEKLKGKLVEVDDLEIKLEVKAGKKSKEKITQNISFDRIKAAKPEISFKK